MKEYNQLRWGVYRHGDAVLGNSAQEAGDNRQQEIADSVDTLNALLVAQERKGGEPRERDGLRLWLPETICQETVSEQHEVQQSPRVPRPPADQQRTCCTLPSTTNLCRCRCRVPPATISLPLIGCVLIHASPQFECFCKCNGKCQNTTNPELCQNIWYKFKHLFGIEASDADLF